MIKKFIKKVCNPSRNDGIIKSNVDSFGSSIKMDFISKCFNRSLLKSAGSEEKGDVAANEGGIACVRDGTGAE